MLKGTLLSKFLARKVAISGDSTQEHPAKPLGRLLVARCPLPRRNPGYATEQTVLSLDSAPSILNKLTIFIQNFSFSLITFQISKVNNSPFPFETHVMLDNSNVYFTERHNINKYFVLN